MSAPVLSHTKAARKAQQRQPHMKGSNRAKSHGRRGLGKSKPRMAISRRPRPPARRV